MDDALRKERNLIEAFKFVRAATGVSDEEFGEAIGWQCDDIADFDAMDDGRMTMYELAAVAAALRLRVTLRFDAMDDSPEAQAAMDAFDAATQGRGS